MVSRIVGLTALAAAALGLAGCPSLSQHAEMPPSVDTAEGLARRGDQAGAAQMYEALAGQNSGTDRNEYSLRAARAYLAAHRVEDAARVLAAIEPPLTPEQTAERPLLDVELSLARGQALQAWQKMTALTPPQTVPEALRYYDLKQKAALASNRLADAVAAQIPLERLLPNAQRLRQSRVSLLDSLRDASERGVKESRMPSDATIRGWLELGPIAATAARNPTAALPEVEAWRARHPNHPANEVVRTELLSQPQQPLPAIPGSTAGSRIALLLPVTGRAGAAATNVRDGFMTAYFQTPEAQRPVIRIYDTGEAGIAETVTRAVQDGADFIVGPLTRDEVTAAADLAGQRPAILALNFLPPERPAPAGFYQFALSPEDEARQIAQRVLAEGRRRGVALVPGGDWGTRVLTAFNQELVAGGGVLLTSAAIDTSLTDYSDAVTQVLRISDSSARHRRLESILGTKLQFEPRRRGDIDFIFAPAPANIERLLRPQLRFHFAGSVPTYSTSDAFEPDSRANEDLEGLMFPDMPWMLGSELADAVRTSLHDAWPTGGPRRGRLFAFGFDSYRLAVELTRRGNTDSSLHIDGLTGRLSVDADRRIRRELGWAQLHDGALKMLPAPAVTPALAPAAAAQ
ncbi:MAG TPA: penicillin-binding protein activator [Steroidobacteraceae bacterium]|nr:penicillin-binding protein activator [Steroidobacteraceae bacterium]